MLACTMCVQMWLDGCELETNTSLSPPSHSTHLSLSPPSHYTHLSLSPPSHSTHLSLPTITQYTPLTPHHHPSHKTQLSAISVFGSISQSSFPYPRAPCYYIYSSSITQCVSVLHGYGGCALGIMCGGFENR